jgi:hypothetical protein
MEVVEHLSGFYDAIRDNPRMGATHISLYMALFHCCNMNGLEKPLLFTSQQIMSLAKIDSRATYHKCLRDLVQSDYLEYIPSCNPLFKNIARLKPLDVRN